MRKRRFWGRYQLATKPPLVATALYSSSDNTRWSLMRKTALFRSRSTRTEPAFGEGQTGTRAPRQKSLRNGRRHYCSPAVQRSILLPIFGVLVALVAAAGRLTADRACYLGSNA